MVATNLTDLTITTQADSIFFDQFILPPDYYSPDDFTDVFGSPLPIQSLPLQLPTLTPKKQPLPPSPIEGDQLTLGDGDLDELRSEKCEELSVKIDEDQVSARKLLLLFNPEDFEVMKVVGMGAFGKVYQVREKLTSKIYAMKVVRKDKVVEKHQCEYMKAEREILAKIDHPFIVKLRCSFQTKYRLYFILDFVNGGHLFFQLSRHGLFREDLARVYTAEIVSAISYLHSNGIIHRDLKPENILLDAEGHVVLADFGLSKEFDSCSKRSNSLCGTVEYMAPEMVLGKGHDKAVDWWSVGVLLFEMLTGKPPFAGGNRQKVQQRIIKERVRLPPFLSNEAHSLLKWLLQKDPSKRLGSGEGGGEEIKKHKWFKPINWGKLESRQIKPSFVPQVDGNDCIANFEEHWTKMPPQVDSPATSPKTSSGEDDVFEGFDYIRPPVSPAAAAAGGGSPLRDMLIAMRIN